MANLDFNTQAFKTNDDGKGNATLFLGIDGQPMRIALDVASNQNYVQITPAVPTDISLPGMAKRKQIIDALLEKGTLISVSGHGVWCTEVDLVTVLNTLKA